MAKFHSGIQMQVHPEFHKEMKEMKNDRVKRNKEMSGLLSDKRFTLAIAKLLKQNVNGIRDILVDCDIDLSREEI